MSADLLSGSPSAPQSLNRYTYVNNDPVNQNDPLGLVSLVGGCSGDDWCSGAIDLAGGGDDPGRDTCPKDAPGCFNNGPEGGGGGGGGSPSKPQVNIEDLRRRLWEALASDPECLGFLGARIGGALGLLDSIPMTFKDLGPASIAAVTEVRMDPNSNRPVDPKIFINENGFFDVQGLQVLVGGKSIGTGTPSFQALTIFHELGHAGGMLADDSRSTSQSQTNSDIIAEKCKKAINSVGSQ